MNQRSAVDQGKNGLYNERLLVNGRSRMIERELNVTDENRSINESSREFPRKHLLKHCYHDSRGWRPVHLFSSVPNSELC